MTDSYQQGTATSAALLTGNPYVVAGAMALDLVAGAGAADAANKAAEERRDAMVVGQTYANRASNLAFQKELDDSADQKLDQQIKALEAESRAQNDTSGVGGVSKDRVLQQYENALGKVYTQYERAERTATQQHKQSMKASNHNLSGRINQIQVAAFDPTQEIIGTGLKIRSMYGSEKGRQSDLHKTTEGKEGESNMSFSSYLGLGGEI
jgi:hypothetical protein